MESCITIDPSEYPLAYRDETIVDDFHGTMVSDPYRWLEDPDSTETKNYVAKLNEISRPFLDGSPVREALKKRLKDLWNYEKYGCTSKHGDYYYYYYNAGLQNQSVLYKKRSLEDNGKIFLDPNKLSDDGTTSIRCQRFSSDGSILAYGLSEKGSDWMLLKFRTVEGEDLEDTVSGVKHSSVAWTANNGGIFYSTYPEHRGAIVGSSTVKHQYHSLYFHKLGTLQKEDILVADFRSDPELMCSGDVTEDGRYLIVDVSKGCDATNCLYFYDLEQTRNEITGKLELKPLFLKNDAKYEFIDNDDSSALILTNRDAPMFKLIRVRLGAENDDISTWETVIEEITSCKLDWVVPVFGSCIVVAYIENVRTTLYLCCVKTGKRLCQFPLGIGSVSGFFGRKALSEIFILFESFFVPGIVYCADLKNLETFDNITLKEMHRVDIKGLNMENFVAEQVFYYSRDGTKVPMYLLHNENLGMNGANPTILNGYGGFNIAALPYFSISRLLFLQHFKGLYACANLRGGSEYGEQWHEAGMREKKQNVFDDFIAAAEYLINTKYTSSQKLAIYGGSNGGLLVAVCSQQRPNLFGAVVNCVGVLDMLRFHKFTIGGAWLPEYGNPDKAADFSFLYKYSPLHNVHAPAESGQWPSTLLMTADHDDRVVPSHSLKYIARLYEVIRSKKFVQKNPVLIRVEMKAGHGSGKPVNKVLEELVDMYSFLQRVLNLQWYD